MTYIESFKFGPFSSKYFFLLHLHEAHSLPGIFMPERLD
jgi:hypothetical protein